MKKKSRKERSETDVNRDGVGYTEVQRMLDRYAEGILGESSRDRSHTDETLAEQQGASSNNSDIETAPQKVQPQVVVFHTNRKRKQRDQPNVQTSKHTGSDSNETPSGVEFDVGNGRLNSKEVLKKIQFDVGSFGMKSFSKEKQREQERQRAIRLGAKPPKNKSKNYRLYIEERKRLEHEAQSKDSLEPMQKKSKKSRPNLPQPKFWKEGNKSLLPQLGKYRNGVLKLSSKDIKSMKGRK